MIKQIEEAKKNIYLKFGVWGDYERVTKECADKAVEKAKYTSIIKYNEGEICISQYRAIAICGKAKGEDEQ